MSERTSVGQTARSASDQSRGTRFTVSVIAMTGEEISDTFYAASEPLALSRHLRNPSVLALLLSEGIFTFTVEADDA